MWGLQSILYWVWVLRLLTRCRTPWTDFQRSVLLAQSIWQETEYPGWSRYSRQSRTHGPAESRLSAGHCVDRGGCKRRGSQGDITTALQNTHMQLQEASYISIIHARNLYIAHSLHAINTRKCWKDRPHTQIICSSKYRLAV